MFRTTSSVCLTAKNEAPYLVEWLAYYRVLGFDEIIVYENNSTDDSDALLSRLAKAGKVTHRKWTRGATESPQISAYQDALGKTRAEWILFVDADEYLVLHNHRKVNDFLAMFPRKSGVDAISINWRVFGTNGHQAYTDTPVIERFTRAALPSFAPNTHLKSFNRVRAIGGLVHMHACEVKGARVFPSGKPMDMPAWGISGEVEYDVAQINHYYAKSPEEYAWKKQRGQGGAGENNPEMKYWYNDESFISHDRNEVEDLSIQKLYGDVKAEMAVLKAILA